MKGSETVVECASSGFHCQGQRNSTHGLGDRQPSQPQPLKSQRFQREAKEPQSFCKAAVKALFTNTVGDNRSFMYPRLEPNHARFGNLVEYKAANLPLGMKHIIKTIVYSC